jgi:hypothetical protein
MLLEAVSGSKPHMLYAASGPASLTSASAAVHDCLASGGPRDDLEFTALARGVHEAQCAAIPALAALAAHRNQGPDRIDHWTDLPAVPVGAYKRFDLYAGSRPPVRTFTSSGTSAGPATVSRAPYSEDGLELMNRVISLNARRMLFPDGLRTRILVLAPPPSAAPGMIMAYGMERLILEHGAEGSRFLLAPGTFDLEAILQELARAERAGVPVTLIGASFGFVHLLDAMASRDLRFSLPPGSRTMDAGGFKGRSREVSAAAMQEAIADRLGIPAPWSVNLLGMTELPSQLYDDGLAAHHEGREPLKGKRVPPWMRTLVIDPESMAPAAPGRPGLLQHIDLANVERPLAVLTDDVGVLEPDGSFRILGRATGAEARGCSISMEAWLATQGKTS